MENEKDAFYVVRKGDIVGVYKSLIDCQAQIGSSVYDSSVTVYKGYGLAKEAEEYLLSRGLKNAICSIGAAEVRPDLFGQLVTCPFQNPASGKKKVVTMQPPEKRPQQDPYGSTSFPMIPQRTQVKLDNTTEVQPVSSYCGILSCSCILEFDGASKGNPGQAGAGAILCALDGSQVYRLREGLGVATNNVAEYKGMILGLNYALQRGFKHIRVQGDSKLVCMQVQGLWKTKNPNMGKLCKIAKELMDQFVSFQISHIDRELNSEADAQANLGVYLASGDVQVECDKK